MIKLKCEHCIHKKICIDGANYKNAEACRNYINEKDFLPVRHGHWYNRGGRFRCSVCDNKALLKDIGGTGGWSHEYEQQKSPYCPDCGAKMDGGENNA